MAKAINCTTCILLNKQKRGNAFLTSRLLKCSFAGIPLSLSVLSGDMSVFICGGS